jgi:tRNA G18 (ribose-2'-O)-methylase SpoU
MISRECRNQLKAERRNALKRYEKHRRRNLLATPGVNPFVVILDHLKAGFNVPKIFRSAEAFGAREIHLIGIGPFDPAPAKGAFKHVPARFHDSFDSCYRELLAQGYRLFALEPGCDNALPSTALPERSAFIFGHEERCMSFERGAYPQVECLTIPQLGSVQSLNVSVAASIVMYEYLHQHPVPRPHPVQAE